MHSSFGKDRRLYGATGKLLNSWNSALHPRDSFGQFIYTDGGLHGRSADKAIPYRKGYRRIGPRMVKTDEIPPNSQVFTAPNGKTFLAPPGANFQNVYNAGKTQGLLGAKDNVWQFGTYDFQRNGGGGPKPSGLDNVFYSAYTDASNYAVGIYMNGAGVSLSHTLDIAGTAAFFAYAGNTGSPRQKEWQTQGWLAAEAQKSAWDKTK